MKIGKYKFASQKEAIKKIKDLNSSKNTIVNLGNIVLENGEYDSEGKEIKEPVLSKFWHVDALWIDEESHPYGWAKNSIDIDSNGVHSFLGLDYNSLKIN
jgi:hypothetical protein